MWRKVITWQVNLIKGTERSQNNIHVPSVMGKVPIERQTVDTQLIALFYLIR